MINNNNNHNYSSVSVFFVCLCKSVIFLSCADQTNLHIKKKKKKKQKEKRRERKETKTCQIMLCTTNDRGWRVGEKLEPPAEANPGGSIWEPGWGCGVGWSWMGPSGSFSAPQAHPVWDRIGDRGASCLVWRDREGERERGGGRGAGQRGKERRRVLTPRGTEMAWSMSWLVYLLPSLAAHISPPSLVQVNGESEGRRVTGENK